MFSSPFRYSPLLLSLILLAACPQVLAQGAFSNMRDMIVEGTKDAPSAVKMREGYQSAIDRFNERFVDPVVRLGDQYMCSAGYKGDECEKLFPRTRERIGDIRESAQNRLKSLAESGQAAVAESRAGLSRLLETDAERKQNLRNMNDLAVMELREQQEREKARIAAIEARAEKAAREFEQRQASIERARKEEAAQAEAAALAAHEADVDKAVMFFNLLGTAVNSYNAERSRLEAQQQAQQALRQQQMLQQQQQYDRQQADFAARKQQYEQQQALQRQQQQQQQMRQQSGSTGGSGSLGYCAKTEGINGQVVCY